MTIPQHSHKFEIPVASRQDIIEGTAVDKAVVPAGLGSAAAAAVKDFASAAQGVKADNAAPATRFIRAGEGLSGGGALTQDITLALGNEPLQAIAAAQKQAEEAWQKADQAGDVYKTELGSLAFKSRVTPADIAAAGEPGANAVLYGDGVWRPLPAGGGGEKGEKGDPGRDGRDGKDGKDGLAPEIGWQDLSLAAHNTDTQQIITLTKAGTELKATVATGFKTVNGQTLLGSGDIPLPAGGGKDDMQAPVYDPKGKAADAFDFNNMSGGEIAYGGENLAIIAGETNYTRFSVEQVDNAEAGRLDVLLDAYNDAAISGYGKVNLYINGEGGEEGQMLGIKDGRLAYVTPAPGGGEKGEKGDPGENGISITAIRIL